MKTITLKNGIQMPILGYGVYQIADYDLCKNSVLKALETGYRSIDTAQAYGNEKAVGDAIKASGIAREELFITTKLWISDYGYEKAQNAFSRSMEKLQLEYLDLYLLHQPYNDVYGSWRALEELNKSGKIKSIGVSNFYPDRLVDLICYNEIVPALNQIETHPFFQRDFENEVMNKYGIAHESWAPFAEGKHDFFNNQVLASIGKKYGKSVAQVTLRWMIQNNIVVIPKSITSSRIEENFDVFDFELSVDDLKQIKNINRNESSFFDHRDADRVKWFADLVR